MREMARFVRACKGEGDEGDMIEDVGRLSKSDLCARMRRGGRFVVGGSEVIAWRTWWRCLL